MMNDVFRECRERVTAEAVARFYGLNFDRRGWALCPFHDDRHPSMSFKDGRFRCWVCNIGGDSIDLTGRLFGLEPLEAVKRLNDDLHLDLPIDRPQTAQEAQRRRELSAAHELFEAWRTDLIRQLNDCFRVAHLALQTLDDLTEAEALAIRWQPVIEHWADCLLNGDMAAQMEIFYDREEVTRLCNRILNNSQTKSGAA